MLKKIVLHIAVTAVAMMGIATYASEARNFNIPPGELATALESLAKQTGLELIFRSDELKGIQTRGVSGNLSPEEAVAKLIDGTRLTLRTDSAGAILIAPPPSKGAVSSTANNFGEQGIRLSQADQNESTQKVEGTEDQNSQSSSKLEEIVVTAQKREQSIQDTSVAVTAVSGEQLLDRGIIDFSGLGKIAPGFQIAVAGNYVKPSMRGAASSFTLHDSSAVAFYMDGISLLQQSQAMAGFIDVARVEVLRGPQGTLFGRNAFGGLVHIVTKQPTEQADAGIDLTVGNYSHVRAEGFVNVPLTDKLYFRLSGAHDERDGYVENIVNAGSDLNDADMDYVRGKLRWVPTNSIDITLSADYWRDNANGGGEIAHNILGIPVDPATNLTNGVTGVLQPRVGVDPTGVGPGGRFGAGNTATLSDPYKIQTDLDTERDLEQVGVYGLTNWNLGFALAKLQLGYVDYTEFWITDGDQSPLPSTAQGVGLYTDYATQEIQLTSPSSSDRPFQWVIGAYFSQEDTANTFFQHFVSDCCIANFPDAGSPNNDMTFFPAIDNIRTNSSAGFAQATFGITDRFRIIAGARYTEERRKLAGRTATTLAVPADAFRDPDSLSFDTVTLLRDSKTFDKFTWKAGLELDLPEQTLLYAHVSTGFLSGNFNGAVALIRTFIPSAPLTYDERSITAYEIGAKNTFLDGSLTLNIAAYRNVMEDLLSAELFEFNSISHGFNTNGGGVTATGVEVEANWAPVAHAVLGLRAAYMDAEYDNFLLVNAFQAGEDFIQNGVGLFQMKGRQVEQSPDLTLGLSGAYEIPVGSMGTITPSVDFYYSSEYRTHAGSYFFAVQDAYTRTDLNLSWRSADDHWRVQLFVRNLEDDEVMINSDLFGGSLAVASMAPPRTYGLRTSYRF